MASTGALQSLIATVLHSACRRKVHYRGLAFLAFLVPLHVAQAQPSLLLTPVPPHAGSPLSGSFRSLRASTMHLLRALGPPHGQVDRGAVLGGRGQARKPGGGCLEGRGANFSGTHTLPPAAATAKLRSSIAANGFGLSCSGGTFWAPGPHRSNYKYRKIYPSPEGDESEHVASCCGAARVPTWRPS